MRIVTPFRPFAPESQAHHRLGAFDWPAAVRMLAASAAAVGTPVHVLTDHDAPEVGVPALRFTTTHRRLMLWLLEVARCYLASPLFDEDTVMVSPDTLVFGDLSHYFRADLGVVVRTAPKYAESGRPLLNSVQWWAVAAKPRLVAFYERALALAERMPEHAIVWGADTEPLLELLAPVTAAASTRAGLTVYGHEEPTVMASLSRAEITLLEAGQTPCRPATPILDFKYTRKLHMRTYFERVCGTAVPA